MNLRKSVKLAEDARAAKLRAKIQKSSNDGTEFTATGRVVEVDIREDQNDSKKHVRFVDQEPSKNYTVRSIDTKEIKGHKPGVEEAIREEMDRRRHSAELRRVAGIRGASALKRAQMVRQKITASFFDDDDDDVPNVVGDERSPIP